MSKLTRRNGIKDNGDAKGPKDDNDDDYDDKENNFNEMWQEKEIGKMFLMRRINKSHISFH